MFKSDPHQKRFYSYTTIALALSFLICFSGCGLIASSGVPNIEPQEPNVVSLDPQDWYIFHSAGMPLHPSADPEGAWSFEFPKAATGGSVNYVQTPFNERSLQARWWLRLGSRAPKRSTW